MKAYLNYLGGGFLAGVPTRNLSEKEAKRHGEKRLLDSGLYKKVSENKKKPKPAENKMLVGGKENKAKE